jgi:CspA family cold shock protein
MIERETGTVKWFNGDRGFGFITRDAGTDVFVHFTDIKGPGFRTLHEGDRVEFNLEESKKGWRATNVQMVV